MRLAPLLRDLLAEYTMGKFIMSQVNSRERLNEFVIRHLDSLDVEYIRLNDNNDIFFNHLRREIYIIIVKNKKKIKLQDIQFC